MFARKEFQGVRHVWDIYAQDWISELWLEWSADAERYEAEEAPPLSLAPFGTGLEAIEG